MIWFIIGLLLLAANVFFGIRDIKNSQTTKSAAFTWLVVGFVASGLMYNLDILL
jgi:hypothetical protein